MASGFSRSSRLAAENSSFKIQRLPSQKKVDKFYRIYQGLDDRFWNGYLDLDAGVQNSDFFVATDDPISVANGYRPPARRIGDMVLPFQTRKEIREYYALQETKDCGVRPDDAVECFRLTLKGL